MHGVAGQTGIVRQALAAPAVSQPLGVVVLIVVAVVVKLGIGYKDANYKVLKVVENTFDVNACTVGEAALAQEWDADKFVLCLDSLKK
ncbi:LppU/SCO3897 family protein [Streptomyces sp. NPDC005070]